MIYLKKVNKEDYKKEFEVIKQIPKNENGFENKYYNVTEEEFLNDVIPKLISHSKGENLPPGYVPETYYFLWDEDKIVGLVKIRHSLNEFLKKGPGHIGYAILSNHRKKGYATKALQLAIEECKELVHEDEIYLSSLKTNYSSLKVQIKCGAYLTGENEEEYFTRIKLQNDKHPHFEIKDLKRNDWKRLKRKFIQIEDIKNNYFEGKVCLLTMEEVASPLEVDSPIGKVKIADNGYKNIIVAPKNKNWWLTVMFDNKNNLIESYFDITRLNNFYNEENPFFIDMKLDVCIPAYKEATIMDDKELKEMLDNKMITKEDFDNAYKVANDIINGYNAHKEEYYKFIHTYLDKITINNRTKK